MDLDGGSKRKMKWKRELSLKVEEVALVFSKCKVLAEMKG